MPTEDDSSGGVLVGEVAEDGRKPVHAEDMTADCDADQFEAEPMMVHVQRRHHHGRDHDHVPGDDAQQSHQCTRGSSDGLPGAASAREVEELSRVAG